MKVNVYDEKGKMKLDAAGKPYLMHAADAVNAAKTGNYKLKREERQFGDTRKTVIVSVHKKNAEDRAEDLKLKRAAVLAQQKELEAQEVALQEELETPEKIEMVEEPKAVVEEGKTLLEEESKPVTDTKKKK